MRKKITNIILLFLSSLLLVSCGMTMQTITLEDNYMTGLQPGEKVKGKIIEVKGRPVLKYNKGDLFKDRYWWALTGITANKEDGVLVVDFNDIGPHYKSFGSSLPLLDFDKDKVVIRIRARAEGKNGAVPLLSMQFDDSEGMQANGSRPEIRIGNTEEYYDYYFDCSDMWIQTYPDKQEVNSKIINKILLYVNPGSSGYTGKLYIKEMEAMPLDSLKENPEFKIPVGNEGGVVARFDDNNLSDWFGSGKYKMTWESEDSCLKVQCADAGAHYENFGVKLPNTMNMKMAYKIKIKARYEGEGYPELRIDAKDFRGYISNRKPATTWLEPTDNGEFLSYLYIYKDNMFQQYPIYQELDNERITDLLFFVNPGKQGWTGTIYIDDIEVIYTGLLGRNSDR